MILPPERGPAQGLARRDQGGTFPGAHSEKGSPKNMPIGCLVEQAVLQQTALVRRHFLLDPNGAHQVS
jgi:hypothetical protein